MVSHEAAAHRTMTPAHPSFRLLSAFLRSPTIVASVLAMMLAACATRLPAPVEDRSLPAPGVRSVPPVVQPPRPAPAPGPEPVDTRPQTYTVKRGDTLYLIALDHGLDYRELAAWNNIENVNLIRIGQVLRLSPPGEAASAGTAATSPGVVTAPLKTVPPVVAGGSAGAVAAAPESRAAGAPATPSAPPVAVSRNSETYKTQPKVIKEPYSERALRDMQRAAAAPTAPAPAQPTVPAPDATAPVLPPPSTTARAEPKGEAKPDARTEAKPAPAAADDEDRLDWIWPATGKLVAGFSDTANLKGIDIAGKAGQPVLASAPGKVVYAGTGLRGYGKLIIIRHSKNYLSAYAHNKDILVKEGQQVTRGQKIAEMGNTDADQVKLHFEIRRLGKPMDPLKYLPPA